MTAIVLQLSSMGRQGIVISTPDASEQVKTRQVKTRRCVKKQVNEENKGLYVQAHRRNGTIFPSVLLTFPFDSSIVLRHRRVTLLQAGRGNLAGGDIQIPASVSIPRRAVVPI